MRLPDRCGAERLDLEVCKVLFQWTAQRTLDLSAHELEGHARRVVLQGFERGGPLGRQQVAPRRKDLAQLDEGGAQCGQEPGEALGCTQGVQPGVGRGWLVEELPAHRQARQQRPKAVTRGDVGHAAQALDIAQRDAHNQRRCWTWGHRREGPGLAFSHIRSGLVFRPPRQPHGLPAVRLAHAEFGTRAIGHQFPFEPVDDVVDLREPRLRQHVDGAASAASASAQNEDRRECVKLTQDRPAWSRLSASCLLNDVATQTRILAQRPGLMAQATEPGRARHASDARSLAQR